MIAAPLIITPAIAEQAKRVVAYARQHRHNVLQMIQQAHGLKNGTAKPFGHDENRVIRIPVGFAAVYSSEEHPGGWYHHFSMSAARHGRVPHPVAIDSALEAMGLPFKHTDAEQGWMEKLSGGQDAINLVFPFTD